ncbi:signal protein [Sphaerisporangium sp. TRM90804]|uniref:signal protein n=1 Tax=Sphaerisporangium sp. TRM90804 TaxID=3031113 RepID=UPI00244B7F92|nr:signal protein [Sphaerisporangium sp. TRM90804]MDH2429360.1 signal protein [Sphaerisporangium sp. TRM90804]
MPSRFATPLLLAVGLLTGCAGAQESSAEGTGRNASPKPAGSSAEAIQGRWWTWAASEGESTNPVTDPTGKFCDRNQPEDVWFLAGTFGGTSQRTCEVPAGRMLVFPLVNRVGSEAVCKEFMATAEGGATLDGKAVTPERMEENDVAVTGVVGNPLTGEEGTATSYACGIWVRLQPLRPGRHTLTIRGSSGDFHTGVDYTLIIKTEQQA